MKKETIHVIGGRTGKEVHTSTSYYGQWGSSTDCGHWLKAIATRFRTDKPITCEKCLERLKRLEGLKEVE